MKSALPIGQFIAERGKFFLSTIKPLNSMLDEGVKRDMQESSMGNTRRLTAETAWIAGALIAILCIFFFWRQIAPERSADAMGPRAILDLLFVILFTLALAAIILGLGRGVLRLLRIKELTSGEMLVFSFTVGAGIVGMALFLSGVGLGLQTGFVLLILLACGVFASPGLKDIRHENSNIRGKLKNAWGGLTGKKRVLITLSGIILLTCFIRAVAPPWDPDGLIYHLQAPRLFLDYGRIVPLPDNAPGNYPLTVEMLFLAGMAFGSDIVARLVNVIFLFIFLGAAHLFAKRYFPGNTVWITWTILISIPILPYWGTLAYADFGWAVFEFLSLYVLLIWRKDLDWGLLILGAILAGFAMGSKYLAAGNTIILAMIVLWVARKAGKRKVITSLLVFGCISMLMVLPWLVKNLAGFQNPIYPLDFGLFPHSREQQLWQEYMQSGFGAGRSVWDYLLLPWNIYYQHNRFATVGGTIELPSLFFPFAIFIVWRRANPIIRVLGWYVLARFVFWAVGAQQIRLLLPLFPGMAVLAAVGLEALGGAIRLPIIRRVLGTGIFGGMLAASLLYQLVDIFSTKPWLSIFGWEPKEAFLTRMVTDYSAERFIADDLPVDAKALLLWDGRGYYCGGKCIPDTFHTQWTVLVERGYTPEQLAAYLREKNIRYLLFSTSDAAFLLDHDPAGVQRMGWEYLRTSFASFCTKEVYRDSWTQLLEITCQN